MKKICYIGAAIAAIGIIIVLLVGLLNPGGYNNSGVDASDFKISELTSEQIVNTEGECKAFMTSFKRSGSRSGISSQYFDDEDGDKTVYSAKKVTGIKNVSATLAKDCTLVLNIDTTLESGNAEVVVIMDDKIVERFNAGEQKTFEYSVSGEHKFYIRILCEEAKISITTTREFK